MSEQKTKYTFKQRIENFFYYYKWPFIFGILAVLVLSMYLPSMFDKSHEEVGDLTIVSAFAHVLTGEDFDIDKRLADTVKDTDNDGDAEILLRQFYITEKRESDSDRLSIAQLEEQFKAGRGDLLIFDAPNLAYYLKKDVFEPLENYVDLSNIPEEDIVRYNDVAIAVKLTKSKILMDMHFIIDEIYAGVLFIPDDADEVTINSRNNTAAAINKLLEKGE